MKNKIKRRVGFILVVAMLVVMIYPGESGSASEEDDGFAIENGVLTDYVGVENAVTIPDTVTAIGDSAFQNTSITSVNIPASVTSIGSYAFSGCAALTEVTVPAGVGSVGSGVFSGCTSLGSVSWQSGAGIPDNAFTDCLSLTYLELSTAVPSIGAEGFKNCESLASITIPPAVSSIGAYAFDGCISMTAINVDSGNAFYTSYDGMLYSSSGVALYRCPQGSRSAAIHEGTQSIESNAFYGCKLGTLNIPGSVGKIGLNALTGSEIQTLILPSSVTSFEDQAFVVNAIEVAEDSPILGKLIEEYGEIVNGGGTIPPDTEDPVPPDTEDPVPPDTEDPVPPDTEDPVPPDTEDPSPGGDVTYKIIEGADGTYSGSGAYTIRADGEFGKFKNVKLDGSLVDASNYDAKSGSTIITLKESYMKSLSAGEHTIQVNFTDGSATAKFKVSSANGNGSGNGGGNSDHGGGGGNGSGNANGSGANGGSGAGSSSGQGTASASSGTTAAASGSQVKDQTPKTGPEENAKYILCFGVMLLGLYMILTSRKESYRTAS